MLILSQDTSFSHNIHKVMLPGVVPWYRERVLSKISLGSLVAVVLLRWVAGLVLISPVCVDW